jgi:hypothetical protein
MVAFAQVWFCGMSFGMPDVVPDECTMKARSCGCTAGGSGSAYPAVSCASSASKESGAKLETLLEDALAANCGSTTSAFAPLFRRSARTILSVKTTLKSCGTNPAAQMAMIWTMSSYLAPVSLPSRSAQPRTAFQM